MAAFHVILTDTLGLARAVPVYLYLGIAGWFTLRGLRWLYRRL